jgi:hypothetical protein
MIRRSRPAYVPVNAHYVNPPGTKPLTALAIAGMALVVTGAAALVVWFALAVSFHPTTPRVPAPDWVTPTTYGPPPATTGVRR